MDSKVSHQIRVGKRQLASSRTEYPSCSYLLPSGPVLTMLGTPDTYVCTVGGTRRIGGERVSVFSNGDG